MALNVKRHVKEALVVVVTLEDPETAETAVELSISTDLANELIQKQIELFRAAEAQLDDPTNASARNLRAAVEETKELFENSGIFAAMRPEEPSDEEQNQ